MFYFAAAIHIFYVLIVWFVVPESLFPSQLSRARRTYSSYKVETSGDGPLSIRKLFRFLAPLRLFYPTKVVGSYSLKTRRDWNLTLLAMSYGFTIMMMVSLEMLLCVALANALSRALTLIHSNMVGESMEIVCQQLNDQLSTATLKFGWTSETVCTLLLYTIAQLNSAYYSSVTG